VIAFEDESFVDTHFDRVLTMNFGRKDLDNFSVFFLCLFLVNT
jgi:hypothetical protein